MRSFDIVMDVDDVLTRTNQCVVELYNAKHGTQMAIEDIQEWDLHKVEIPHTSIMEIFNIPGFFRDLPLMAGAQIVINRLLDDGHEIFIATAIDSSGVADRAAFLREFFPRIKEENIMYIQRKDRIACDIMLDDGLHNLANTLAAYPVVFDRPWNQADGVNYKDLIRGKRTLGRVQNWEEFYVLVQCLAEQEKYGETEFKQSI